MALAEPAHVKERMKALRKRSGLTQYEMAAKVKAPHRTFQSWENAEVETDKANYETVAAVYAKLLEEPVTANWILFGQDVEPPVALPAPAPDPFRSSNGHDEGATLGELRALVASLTTTVLAMRREQRELVDAVQRLTPGAPGEQPGS